MCLCAVEWTCALTKGLPIDYADKNTKKNHPKKNKEIHEHRCQVIMYVNTKLYMFGTTFGTMFHQSRLTQSKKNPIPLTFVRKP